jgi:hypothetical protein
MAEMGPLTRLVPVSVTWDPAELMNSDSPALDQLRGEAATVSD